MNCLREHISETKPGMAAAMSWKGQINETGGKIEGQMMRESHVEGENLGCWLTQVAVSVAEVSVQREINPT